MHPALVQVLWEAGARTGLDVHELQQGSASERKRASSRPGREGTDHGAGLTACRPGTSR